MQLCWYVHQISRRRKQINHTERSSIKQFILTQSFMPCDSVNIIHLFSPSLWTHFRAIIFFIAAEAIWCIPVLPGEHAKYTMYIKTHFCISYRKHFGIFSDSGPHNFRVGTSLFRHNVIHHLQICDWR